MPRDLTPKGKCPGCGAQIARLDKGNARHMFYAVKSMVIDEDNGSVASRCLKCKTEINMPAIKMPRRVKRGQ